MICDLLPRARENSIKNSFRMARQNKLEDNFRPKEEERNAKKQKKKFFFLRPFLLEAQTNP